MLSLAQSKTTSMRPTSMDQGKTMTPATTTLQWSRSSRYTLKVPLIAKEMSSDRIIRQVETVLYIPSNSFRSLDDAEQEACNAIFGALYEKGERTNFDIYAQLEVSCHLQPLEDSVAGCVSPVRHKMNLEEHNWEEVMDMVLLGKASRVEMRANWWRSRKSGGVSRNRGQTPSNFAPKRSAEQTSGILCPGKEVSAGPRRSGTSSGRSSRSAGTALCGSPNSKADSGTAIRPASKK